MGSVKEFADEMLSSYFNQQRWLINYFGIDRTDWCEYHFTREDETWDFVGSCDCAASKCSPDYVVWGQGSDGDIPRALTGDDCCYKEKVKAVFETPHHTLVYIHSKMHGYAIIFDNSKRFSMQDHMRTLRKMDAPFPQ